MIFRHNVLRFTFSYKKTLTRISTTSRTLIDNIFFNGITKNITSGIISEHLAQYLLVTNKHGDVPLQKKENFIFRDILTIKTLRMKSI